MGDYTVFATLSGIELPDDVASLQLGNAVIYRNPAVRTVLLPPMGPNALGPPRENGEPMQVSRLVIRLSGHYESDAIPMGATMRELELATLPVRLGTEARILLQWARQQGASDGCLDVSIELDAPQPVGHSVVCRLSPDDCNKLETLAERLKGVNLEPFHVPIGLFFSSMYRQRPTDRGLDLITAIEALFSEGPESIAYKISFRMSCLLETRASPRKQVFDLVKQTYSHRNTLVHGNSTKRAQAEAWFGEHNEAIERLLRRSLIAVSLAQSEGHLLTPERLDDYLFRSGLLDSRLEPPDTGVFPLGSTYNFYRLL